MLALSRSVLPSNRAARARNMAILYTGLANWKKTVCIGVFLFADSDGPILHRVITLMDFAKLYLGPGGLDVDIRCISLVNLTRSNACTARRGRDVVAQG